jgi:hypothetical protein
MSEDLNAPEQPGTPDSEAVQPSMEDRLASKFGFDTQNDEGTVEVETPDAEADGAEQPIADSEEVEVEFNGKTYRVPKELQDARLRHEDYTRKTQDIAERARVIDAQARMVQEQQQFQAAHAADLQALSGLQQQIAEYSRVDMSQLGTDQLLKLKMHLDTLKEQERARISDITQKAQEFQGKVNQSLAQLQAQGEQTLRKTIPKWGPEAAKELSEYGVTQGYQAHELAQLYDPRHVQTLWKAQQWDKLQATKPSVQNRANAAAPALKPGASNPEMNKRMEKVRFAKSMQTAKTPSQRNDLILSRLEKLV